ncbi:MAG: site-specific integrase, partial [Anaerolineaceae bacterium]|nr:site-specific integrase [Anaerolineaceae bacterium]
GGGFELTAPKTRAGVRRINLGKNTLKVLREHRQEQFLEMQAAGIHWQEQDLIFTSNIGTPMDRSNLRWFFKKLLKDAGLPNIRFHDLRHTAASLMLNNGIPLIIVSRRLGHAQPSITLDVYGHLIPGKQQEAASLMDDLLTPIQIEIQK